MNVKYEVYAEIGASDVLEFDDLDSAIVAAQKWHEETGEAFAVVKVTEEIV